MPAFASAYLYEAFSNSSNIASREVMSWKTAPLEMFWAVESTVNDWVSQSTNVLSSKNFSGLILKIIKDFLFEWGIDVC